MTFTSLGRVNQTAPGTPVKISTNPTQRVTKILFQVVPGLTGKAYVGTPTMNKTTFAGVARVLVPASGASILDQFFLETADGTDELNLTEYAFDMDNSGEGLIISYWTT